MLLYSVINTKDWSQKEIGNKIATDSEKKNRENKK